MSERQRKKSQKDIGAERQRDRETERQRDRETERQRDRKTERQRDSETERQRDKELERYSALGSLNVKMLSSNFFSDENLQKLTTFCNF